MRPGAPSAGDAHDKTAPCSPGQPSALRDEKPPAKAEMVKPAPAMDLPLLEGEPVFLAQKEPLAGAGESVVAEPDEERAALLGETEIVPGGKLPRVTEEKGQAEKVEKSPTADERHSASEETLSLIEELLEETPVGALGGAQMQEESAQKAERPPAALAPSEQEFASIEEMIRREVAQETAKIETSLLDHVLPEARKKSRSVPAQAQRKITARRLEMEPLEIPERRSPLKIAALWLSLAARPLVRLNRKVSDRIGRLGVRILFYASLAVFLLVVFLILAQVIFEPIYLYFTR